MINSAKSISIIHDQLLTLLDISDRKYPDNLLAFHQNIFGQTINLFLIVLLINEPRLVAIIFAVHDFMTIQFKFIVDIFVLLITNIYHFLKLTAVLVAFILDNKLVLHYFLVCK